MTLSLITGGAGFIGSNLVGRLIDQSNNIIVLDNLITSDPKNVEQYKNLENFTFIEKNRDFERDKN